MRQQLNVRVSVETFRKLKAKAALEGKSLTQVITELVEQYLKEADNDTKS